VLDWAKRLAPRRTVLTHMGVDMDWAWLGAALPAGVEAGFDGQVLDVPGAPRIIHVPGHTPGSIAVHVPAVDALFIGDTMTTRNVLTGVTGPKPAPFTLEPEQAIASLGHLDEVDATWVLPGHGPAWDGGVTEAVRLIREAAAVSNSK